MKIREATIRDLDKVTEVERICFPETEAAARESFYDRLTCYPNHFWLLEDGDNLIGFLNGLVTDRKHLEDQMYEDAFIHDENGRDELDWY